MQPSNTTEMIKNESNSNEISNEIVKLKNDLKNCKKENEILKDKLLTQEKDIQTLNQEKKTLISITETNKNKAKERVQQLKQTIKDNIEAHNKEIKEVEEERQQFLSTIENQKLKIKQQSDEIKQLKKSKAQNSVEIEQSQKSLNDIRLELDSLRSVKQENSDLNEELRSIRLELTTKQQLLANECAQTERLREMIQDKDATISKLKETVQFYTKQEQTNKKTIEDLRTDLCKLTERFAQVSANISRDSSQDNLISKLELEKAELENKLKNSQASADLVAKNRQLSIMMEKSNRLYTMLLNEHQNLVKEYERIKPQNYTKRNMVLSVNIDNMTIKPSKIKPRETKNGETTVTFAYLRRTLIQFFTDDPKNRASLIPLILDLVGCTKEQIDVTVKEFERSQQLISKTSRFFFK